MRYFRDDVIQFQIKETATINCKMCPLKHQWVDATVGGLLDPAIIMHPVFRTFLKTWGLIFETVLRFILGYILGNYLGYS